MQGKNSNDDCLKLNESFLLLIILLLIVMNCFLLRIISVLYLSLRNAFSNSESKCLVNLDQEGTPSEYYLENFNHFQKMIFDYSFLLQEVKPNNPLSLEYLPRGISLL